MHKQLLIILLAAGSALPGLAQTAPPPPSAGAAPTARPATREDTVRAIGNLFERRRGGGHNWLYVAGGGLLGLARVLANPNTTTVNGYQTRSEVDAGAATVFGLGFLAAPAAFGVSKLVRFSEKRETEVINTYVATHRLPGSVAHHLRRKDLAPPKQ